MAVGGAYWRVAIFHMVTADDAMYLTWRVRPNRPAAGNRRPIMTSVLSYAPVAAAACGVPHFPVWAAKVGYGALAAMSTTPR